MEKDHDHRERILKTMSRFPQQNHKSGTFREANTTLSGLLPTSIHYTPISKQTKHQWDTTKFRLFDTTYGKRHS